jgi:hypothetical protein
VTFLTVLAWIFAPLATIVCALSVWFAIAYEGSLEQKLHAMQGKQATFPLALPAFIVAVITWAWLITGWLQ